MLPRLLATCYILLSLSTPYFDPEDGGEIFLRNVGWVLSDYVMLFHRKQDPFYSFNSITEYPLKIIYSTPKMEAKFFSETSVDFYLTTWCFSPENKTNFILSILEWNTLLKSLYIYIYKIIWLYFSYLVLFVSSVLLSSVFINCLPFSPLVLFTLSPFIRLDYCNKCDL
jgi:hypothetical protein